MHLPGLGPGSRRSGARCPEVRPCAAILDLLPGQKKGARALVGRTTHHLVSAVPLLAVRRGARVDVLANACSHLAGPLDQGELTEVAGETCSTCPWHSGVDSLATGEVVHGPSTAPQPRFETRVVSGLVEVLLPGAGRPGCRLVRWNGSTAATGSTATGSSARC